MIKVLFTGGSTGGHLYPLLAVAEEIIDIARQKHIPLRLYYVGARPFRFDDMERLGIEIHLLPGIKLRQYSSIENILDFLRAPFEFLSAFFTVFSITPDVVFSKGGPGSLFVVIAGKLTGAKVIIHDSDSAPGRTNLFAERFADDVLISFEGAQSYFKKKCLLVGNPVSARSLKSELGEADWYSEGIDKTAQTILVMGGSQGAQKINEFLMLILPELVKKYQVIHQCGERNFAATKELSEFILNKEVPYRRGYYKLYGFADHPTLMKLMNFSSLIVNRAGGSIFEIAALGKPSILIPLPKEVAANDHQSLNAYSYAKTGAAIVLEEGNLKEGLFMSIVDTILSNTQKREEMVRAAKAFAKPDAAVKIAELILESRN